MELGWFHSCNIMRSCIGRSANTFQESAQERTGWARSSGYYSFVPFAKAPSKIPNEEREKATKEKLNVLLSLKKVTSHKNM